MHPSVNAPMPSHGMSKGFDSGETEQIVARFPCDLATNPSLSPYHANALQACPAVLPIQERQDIRLGDGPILPRLHAPMPLLDSAIRLMMQGSKLVFESQSECLADAFVHGALIVF